MSDVTIPRYTVGIDMVTDETALPSGAVRDALNVDFDDDGLVRRRPGATSISNTATHSLWSSANKAYCVQGGNLCRVNAAGASPIFALPNSAPLSFDNMTDRTLVGNNSWIGEILPGDLVRDLGVQDGSLSGATASAVGGLAAGRYGVAVSFMRGSEEGGLSSPMFVDVPDGGGITIEVPVPNADVDRIRCYRTTPNGDVLYRVDDFLAGMTSFLVGNSPIGRAADNEKLRRMPPGSIVRSWNGRALVARGRALMISEPFRYGVYSPRHGFIQEASPIRLVAPVDGGVFVGTDKGVSFYRGGSPKEWVRNKLGTEPPIPGTHQRIDTKLLNPRLQYGGTNQAALWLSPTGFVVGLADGTLMQPQSDRILLSAQRGSTTIFGRKAISFVQ